MSFNEQYHDFKNVHVGISPNSWYHQCTSLDTDTGVISFSVAKATLESQMSVCVSITNS